MNRADRAGRIDIVFPNGQEQLPVAELHALAVVAGNRHGDDRLAIGGSAVLAAVGRRRQRREVDHVGLVLTVVNGQRHGRRLRRVRLEKVRRRSRELRGLSVFKGVVFIQKLHRVSDGLAAARVRVIIAFRGDLVIARREHDGRAVLRAPEDAGKHTVGHRGRAVVLSGRGAQLHPAQPVGADRPLRGRAADVVHAVAFDGHGIGPDPIGGAAGDGIMRRIDRFAVELHGKRRHAGSAVGIEDGFAAAGERDHRIVQRGQSDAELIAGDGSAPQHCAAFVRRRQHHEQVVLFAGGHAIVSVKPRMLGSAVIDIARFGLLHARVRKETSVPLIPRSSKLCGRVRVGVQRRRGREGQKFPSEGHRARLAAADGERRLPHRDRESARAAVIKVGHAIQIIAVRQQVSQRHLDVVALHAAALQRHMHRGVVRHGGLSQPAAFQRQRGVFGQKEIVDPAVCIRAGVLNRQVHVGNGDLIGGRVAAAVVVVVGGGENAAVEVQRVGLAVAALPSCRDHIIDALIQRHRAAAFQPCGHGAGEVIISRAVHHSGDGLAAVNAVPVFNNGVGAYGSRDVLKLRERGVVLHEGAVLPPERASRRQNGARRADAAAEAQDCSGGQRDLAVVVHVEQFHCAGPAGENRRIVRVDIKTADIAGARDVQGVDPFHPSDIQVADVLPVQVQRQRLAAVQIACDGASAQQRDGAADFRLFKCHIQTGAGVAGIRVEAVGIIDGFAVVRNAGGEDLAAAGALAVGAHGVVGAGLAAFAGGHGAVGVAVLVRLHGVVLAAGQLCAITVRTGQILLGLTVHIAVAVHERFRPGVLIHQIERIALRQHVGDHQIV